MGTTLSLPLHRFQHLFWDIWFLLSFDTKSNFKGKRSGSEPRKHIIVKAPWWNGWSYKQAVHQAVRSTAGVSSSLCFYILVLPISWPDVNYQTLHTQVAYWCPHYTVWMINITLFLWLLEHLGNLDTYSIIITTLRAWGACFWEAFGTLPKNSAFSFK